MDEYTITCKECSKGLVHYHIYDEEQDITQTILAGCPFCDGSSFEVTITGLFRIGPIGADESSNSTVIIDVTQDELDELKWHIEVGKS